MQEPHPLETMSQKEQDDIVDLAKHAMLQVAPAGSQFMFIIVPPESDDPLILGMAMPQLRAMALTTAVLQHFIAEARQNTDKQGIKETPE